MPEKIYCGLDKDQFGGMTPPGNIIKDAWLFGILPETENWTHGQLQVVNEKVKIESGKYGCLVSNLPDDLKQRHAEINTKAVKKAKVLGWGPTPPDDEV
ncbi:MAG: hypothetical protein JSW45_10975 [Thiotrichales bacterium]|nr:MAG: hypothetical protein JSW45_10975 [Thiotrichales bacterium]